MKKYTLNYYSNFKCIADKCKHTCCAGWIMNIDAKSLNSYKKDSSAFAKRLNDGIDFEKSVFKRNRKGQCAFLNKDGLCDIIINLGEKSLCQVCSDHPRFRSFFSDRIEMGLGFSCEQATKVILTYPNKIEPILINDSGKEKPLDFNQQNILAFRQKVFDIIQDRSHKIDDRINAVLKECRAQICEKDFIKVINRFYNLERLNKSWSKRLDGVRKISFNKTTDEGLSLYAEQFLVNSIYRHLSSAEDTLWVRARTIMVIVSWWLIKAIFDVEKGGANDHLEVLCDVVREYSAEVEYSQENAEKLYNFAYKFIKLS